MSKPAAHNWIVRLYHGFCQLIYQDLSWAYDLTSWLVSFGQWWSWQKLSLNHVGSGRILELGFGTGHLHATMLKSGMDVIGLELSKDMHRHCAKRLSSQRLHGRCVRGNGMLLPFADASFDHIVATFPEAYILEPATLRECRRVLKKPGSFSRSKPSLVITGHWITLNYALLQSCMPVFFRSPGSRDVERLREAFKNAGLELGIHAERRKFVSVYTIIGCT